MNLNLPLTYKKAFLCTLFLMLLMGIVPTTIIFLIELRIKNSIPASLFSLLNLLFYPIGFLFFWFFFEKKPAFKFFIPLSKFESFKNYVFLFTAFISIVIFTSYISSFLFTKEGLFGELNKSLEEEIKKLAENKISFFISAVIMAPVLEEVFFRGFLLKGLLKNKISPWKAILFSSFLFGFIHINPIQFVSGFIIGSFFGFVYFYTKSLLNCILLHGINNAISIWIIFIGKEKKVENYFLQMHWIYAFFALLTAIGIVFHISRKKLELQNLA